MSLYSKKLWRELLAEKGQSLAVAVVTGLGVMLFILSAGAYRDLSSSYAATRERLHLAPVHVDLPEVNAQALAAVRALPEVRDVEPRLVLEAPVQLGDRRANLRVLSLPDGAEPTFDTLLLLEGRLPRGAGEVVLEKHFARAHHLTEGSSLRLGARGEQVAVTGVAVSAEYLWVARDANDFMPSPDQFGVGWMRRAAQRELAKGELEGAGGAELQLAASASPGNQLLVGLVPGADAHAAARAIERAVGGTVRATPSDELVGVKLMQMDLDGYKGMAAFFPFFFLGVGAFIVGSALARRVDAQRAIIGTLAALGVSRARVLRHYLAAALALGVGGGAAGAVLGQLLAPAVTRAYADELGIPFVEWHLHLDLCGWGLAMGVAVAVLAGLAPALRAMRLQPAEAMRAVRPHLGGLARLARRLPLPLQLKLALRGVLGRPLGSFGTALGVASAVVLVLATGVLLDAMKTTFSVLFEEAQTYDARVDFAALTPASRVLEEVRRVEGVTRAEAVLAMPAVLEANGHRVDVLLQAPEAGAKLLRAMDVDGTEVTPPDGGLALTRAAAKKLKVAVGDLVTVTVPVPGQGALRLKLSGFADASMGSTATVTRASLDEALGSKGLLTSVVVAAPGRSAKTREALAARFPGALRVEDAAAAREQFMQLMSLGWLMLSFMLLFAGVLAAAILFNTATLTVLERWRDLATLRALGQTMREVTALITIEHALLTVLGLVLGLPLAVLAAKAMLHAFESELFSLPFVLLPQTVAFTLAGVLVTVLLAQWPALRRVSRSSLADAVRVREG